MSIDGFTQHIIEERHDCEDSWSGRQPTFDYSVGDKDLALSRRRCGALRINCTVVLGKVGINVRKSGV